MRSRHQAGGTPQTQGQFELPDGYQYARVHYSGDPSLVSSKSLLSPPPPPEILKLSMVIIVVPSILAILFYMLLDISMCHQNVGKFVPDCNLRGSKFSLGGGMPPDPPSRHTCLCARVRAFAHYYHPATILSPPPNSKSCMKPCMKP